MKLIKKIKQKLGIGTPKQNVLQTSGTVEQAAQKERLIPSLAEEHNRSETAVAAQESSSQPETSSTSQIGLENPPIQSPLNTDDSDVPIRELWNLAYDRLRKEDEQLINNYETKIQKNLGASIGHAIGPKISMRDQTDIILRNKIDEVNQNSWKLRFGSSEVQVKDLAQSILGVVNWANEYITGALTPNPCASMAWAGVGLLLPLCLNPSKQAASLAKGLQDISSLLAQSRMREDLYVRQYEAKARTGNPNAPTLSHQEYKNSLELLYREILRFQATSYCYYASNDAFRLGLDIVKWDDWEELLGQIHDKEHRLIAVEALWRDSKYSEECLHVERRHQEMLHQWGEIGTDLSSLRTAVELAQTEKSRQELLSWLSDVDPSEIYNTARDRHGAGTGEWLTRESQEFKAWKESPSSFLWLHGKAGSGKSILSSVVIKHLHDQHASNPLTALAYFFFSFSDLKKQSVNQMLASLAKQLCSRRPDTPQAIRSLGEYKEKGQHPDTETLGAMLTTVARGFSTVYIVIDALDECPSQEGERKRLFSSLRQIMAAAPANLHMFCTSRKEADIDSAMGVLLPPPLEVAMIDLSVRRNVLDHDIGLFIDSTLASGEYGSWPETIRAEARKSLIEKADGMFQYIFFQLETLRRLSSAHLIREALQNLPLGLDATYNRLLLGLDITFRSHIISCLKWLAFSNEVLELEQLAEIFILCLERAFPLNDSERLFDPRDVLKYLSSLIVVQVTENNFGRDKTHIRLAHFSIKEYLISSRICKGPAKAFAFSEVDAHLHIAHCCLAYHLQRSAAAGNDVVDLQLRKYAVVQWPSHLEMVPRASWPVEITQAARRTLAIRSASLKHQVERVRVRYDESEPIYMWLHPHCYTAQLGYTQLTGMLLSRETGVNKYLTQSDLNAALHYAAYGGCIAAAQLCLEKGAEVNSKSDVFGGALHAAAFKGHAAMVNHLLDRGADINAKRDGRGPALQTAADRGQLDILKLLVSRGADIDLPSNESSCVLSSAITGYSWSSNCLLYLLDAGADINRRGCGIHGTALHMAAMELPLAKEHFHLLLERGADVNAPGGKYGYPLQAACTNGDGCLEEIELLLDRGADVNARGGKYGNALQAACRQRRYSALQRTDARFVVELLIDRGADVHAEGGKLGTALQAACSNGCDKNIVSLLLDKGADVKTRGGKYGSALNAACFEGFSPRESAAANSRWHLTRLPLIKRLLDSGAELNRSCGGRGTALQAACEGGEIDLVRWLLDRGAEVNAQGGKYGTALQAACAGRSRDRLNIVGLLLEHGAHVHAQGGFFGSAWHAAASEVGDESTQVLQQLLDLGVDINDARGKQHPTALHAVLGSTPSMADSFADEKWMVRFRFLISHGANVNLAAGTYGFPLQSICAMRVERTYDASEVNKRHEDRAIFLLNNCADLDFNKQGGLLGSALQAAAWTRKSEVVRILLDKGADVNACGGKYGSPLNAAVFGGHWDVVEMLLDHGAKPDCYHSQETDKAWLQQVEKECGEEAVERYQLFWAEQKCQRASSV